MPSDDPKFERALAQHLRGGSARANCPDPETLAAYHEQNLSLEEMARWKEHISACEMCQETLALVETTENQLAEVWEQRGVPALEAAPILAKQAASSPKLSAKDDASASTRTAATPIAILRRRPVLLRWAIPLGAVAAAVLVFIGFYEQRAAKVAQSSDAVIARRQEPATPGPMLDAGKRKEQLQRESKDEGAFAEEMSRQKTDLGLPGQASPKLAERTTSGKRGIPESGKMAAGTVVPKKIPEPPSASPEILQAESDAAVPANAPVVAAAPRPAPPSAPLAYGGAVGGAAAKAPAHADAKTSPPSATQTATVESQALPLNGRTDSRMKKQGVSNELVELTQAGSGLILTPDSKVFWKLQAGATVQLTTNGGKDWKPIETGASADLTAGFGPSARVCWIAGKAGTLVLTTDRGRHWARISTPIAGDLGGVHAVDAKHASIWDAARHTSYETSDGGATWKQTTDK